MATGAGAGAGTGSFVSRRNVIIVFLVAALVSFFTFGTKFYCAYTEKCKTKDGPYLNIVNCFLSLVYAGFSLYLAYVFYHIPDSQTANEA